MQQSNASKKAMTTTNNNNGTFFQNINKSVIEAVQNEVFEETESPEIDESEISPKPFPTLGNKCFHGLAGDIVRTIEPHTEAHNAALLLQFLAGFGNIIGKTAHFKVGAVSHYLKIFTVLVGATSTGRKGTSWSEIERLLLRSDPTFQNCIQNGLSSGEGLIYHVRDERKEKRPIKKQGRIVDYQDEIVDGGATEKRAFVIEPEFARVLKAISRKENTLSTIIREAWDRDRLQVMTKSPLKASEAHISICGHITELELVKNLTETEIANGFANRLLWCCVKRSKLLPDGGNISESLLNGLVQRLNSAIGFARQTSEIKRDDEAREKWHQIYKKLSDGYGGLLGSVTSRATAQVMRLACIYALLDSTDVISLTHLEAALSVWQYCEDSAKYIFGMSSGDKVAEEIYSALLSAKKGLTGTEINNHFKRNRTSSDIQAGLQTLLDQERIERIKDKNTGGRPREIYKVINKIDTN